MFFYYLQRYLGRVLSIGLQMAVLVLIIRFFILGPTEVNGQSMEPTFIDTDFLLVSKLIYLTRPPQRFEVVQLINPQDSETLLIKRIIGLPGETIILRERKVFISLPFGEEFEIIEPYLAEQQSTFPEEESKREFIIPEHSYFVLGDNREFSRDSRNFGPVHRRLINGLILNNAEIGSQEPQR